LVNDKDNRPNRLDAGIKRLLKSDFKVEPRSPRRIDDRVHIRFFLENKETPKERLASFVHEELAWYHEKGFSPADLRRLAALARTNPKA
jgi:hypothetical protein